MAAQVNMALTTRNGYGFDPDTVALIKEQVARGATDTELSLFLYTASRTGLDPLARQIYCIKRWDSSLNKEVMSTQVSIDGLRLVADRTGRYAPGRAPTFEYDAHGKLVAATSYVLKYVRGTWHEVAATAYYDEYAAKKRDGTPTAMWATKPRIMLAKCAEALALRRAFPAELSGLYTSDEMGDNEPSAARTAAPIVERGTGEIVDTTARVMELEPPALPVAPEPAANGNDAPLPGNWAGMLVWINEDLPEGVHYENEWHLRQAVAGDINNEHLGEPGWVVIDGKKMPYPSKPESVRKVKERAVKHALAKLDKPAAALVPDYEGEPGDLEEVPLPF